MFIDISSFTFSFSFISGNKKLIIGFNKLVNFETNVVVWAIFIIPFHKHIVPNNVIDSWTALAVDSNIELFTDCTFPVNIAYIKDTIINIGHNMFNIFSLPIVLL